MPSSSAFLTGLSTGQVRGGDLLTAKDLTNTGLRQNPGFIYGPPAENDADSIPNIRAGEFRFSDLSTIQGPGAAAGHAVIATLQEHVGPITGAALMAVPGEQAAPS
jgi:hypothetical protein